jgi:hypothetical protein
MGRLLAFGAPRTGGTAGTNGQTVPGWWSD